MFPESLSFTLGLLLTVIVTESLAVHLLLSVRVKYNLYEPAVSDLNIAFELFTESILLMSPTQRYEYGKVPLRNSGLITKESAEQSLMFLSISRDGVSLTVMDILSALLHPLVSKMRYFNK